VASVGVEGLESRLFLSVSDPLTLNADVGSPKIAGSATYSNGAFTVAGEGADIWNKSDQFHYNYANIAGDSMLAAKVTSVQNTASWAKAGVMIRATTSSNSAFADIVVTPQGHLSFQWRTKSGNSCNLFTVEGKTAPQWVELVRSGNVFSAWYGSDGVVWKQLGSNETIVMSSKATAGLAVCSLTTTKKCTATFTNVTLKAGATIPLPAPTLKLTSPAEYQVFQRKGSTGAIKITGTVTGAGLHEVQASFHGGAFQTIAANVAAGAFAGSLTGQAQGQGTLVVRLEDQPQITASVAMVGIGDVFIIAGQSNASGRATNPQSYTPSHGVTATIFGNDYIWHNLADPTDSPINQVDLVSDELSPANATHAVNGNPGGSYWPILATDILANQAVPVAFIPCALGGSSIAQWAPGANHQDRTTLYGSMIYRAKAVGGVRGVLWEQGETDAHDGVATADYQASLAALAAAIHADLGVKLIAAKLQSGGTYATQPQTDAINAAIGAEWAADPNVAAGADLSGLIVDDGYAHIITNADMAAAGALWWSAIASSVYSLPPASTPPAGV
jgi:hypothetical protein